MLRRTKIIILAIIGLVLVAIVWLVLVNRRRPAPRPSLPTPSGVGTPTASVGAAPPAAPLSTAGVASGGTVPPTGGAAQVGVEVLTRSFVERYGSYSNQSNFENLENLYSFMTSRLRRESAAFVVKQRAAQPDASEAYSGVTTRVLSVKTLAKSEGEATLRATTQRTEAKAGSSPRVYYQDIELALRNVGGEWKIDVATWK